MSDDDIEEAKLNDVYTFRLPHHTKKMAENLSTEDRADLNKRLRVAFAKKLHELSFDPMVYLGR
ncbi:MAG: hypothetical protein HZA08_04975 [Nitrospirae bacterium]|nr:hypothetical protein [Nitrospirota bacterium]